MLGKSEITTTAKSTVYLPLNIDDSIFPVQAMILKDLPFDIVLGMDFLNNYKAVINISKNSLQLETDTDPVSKEIYAILNHNSELPPGCETIVDVKSSNPIQGTSLIATSTVLAERKMIHVAKRIIEFKDKLSQVIISNLGCKHVSLPKGTILATIK